MVKKIEDIEGIGPKFGESLRKIGVNSPNKLLARGASRKDREQLAQESGIDQRRLLKWVNLCDLCRVSGISTQYSELLEAAGVDTVKELRNRNPQSLTVKMQEVNTSKNLVRQTPSPKRVSQWVEQAKTLNPVVTH